MRPFLAARYLDPGSCRRLRDAMNRGVAEAAEIAGDSIAEHAHVRLAAAVEISEAVQTAIEDRIEAARPALEGWFNRPLGAREGTGLLRYGPGGFYRPHRDRGDVSGWPAAARRAVSVVLFLNEDFDGGVLRLYPDGREPQDVIPTAGLLAAFPAAMLHEVLPVTRGTRDVAVDWFYDVASILPREQAIGGL